MNECESLFLEKIALAETYPDSLIHQNERRPALRSCLEHYAANRDAIFDGPPSRIDTPLIIIDFDDAESWSKEEGPRGVNLHIIRNVIGLRRKLAWPSPSEITMESATLVRDPALRIVLLERLSPTSLLLNLSEKVLFELLTYHQVPSCLLNFLTSGGESWSFASSMRFAGFQGTTSLASGQGMAVPNLGRSGSHIQLCLTMFSMRRYSLHAWPKGEDPSKTPRWQPHAAAVYVHFDVVEGTGVWLLTSPRSYHREKGKGTQNLLWDTTKPYLHPFDDGDDAQTDAIHEVDLRRMAFLMEQRHRSAMRVDSNLRVLRRLREFLTEQVSDELDRLDLRHAGGMQAHLDRFKGELSSAMEEMEDLMQRAQALDKLAGNREEYIQRMQTHHANQQMKSIAELTADDSAAMKQLSFIALILLPVTVVSVSNKTPNEKQGVGMDSRDDGMG
ncbi:hypothetical protein K4K59_002647 [Colletotrichum sp. SAR11_240]|nr:hypothetical protein K4K59_002647 [Colletotrichum sp. SAR11_240]